MEMYQMKMESDSENAKANNEDTKITKRSKAQSQMTTCQCDALVYGLLLKGNNKTIVK